MYSLPAPQRYRNVYQRQASSWCTHTTVTRLYDNYDCQRCSFCRRVPHLGFLYRCTQESDGNLPISDFVDEDMSIDLADLSVQNASANSDISCTASTLSSSHPTTATFSTNITVDSKETLDTDVATDEALAQAYSGKRKFEAAFPPRTATSQPSPCELRICHTCRPVLRDRSWQSLNRMVNNTPNVPHYELENRRISNANIIKGIRLPTDPYTSSPHTALAPVEVPLTDHKIDTTNWAEDAYQPLRQTADPGFTDSVHDNSASDADDEKDFTKEDESDDWNTDIGEYSTAHSQAKDSLPRFDTRPSVLRPISNQQPSISSDLEKLQHRSKKDFPGKRSAEIKDEAAGENGAENIVVKNEAFEPRFYFD